MVLRTCDVTKPCSPLPRWCCRECNAVSMVRNPTKFWYAQAAFAKSSNLGVSANYIIGHFIVFIRGTKLSHPSSPMSAPTPSTSLATPSARSSSGNHKLQHDLITHVYGSIPLIGSGDSSKALSMEHESTSMWELSFIVSPNHDNETLDFKFLLKPKYGNAPCVVEEGPNRLLTRGTLEGDARLALFRLKCLRIRIYLCFNWLMKM